MLDILENKAGNEEDLLAEMEKLPETLTALYADRLKNVKDSQFASRMLQWLVTCRRPLTVDALREVDTISRDVLSKKSFDLDVKNPPRGLGKDRFGNDRFQSFLFRDLLPLVEILDDSTVRLVHMTVSQFLLGEEVEEDGEQCPDAFKVQLDVSNEQIAITCVTYLRWSFTVDDELKSDSLDFLNNKDLRDYAVLEWPDHCEKSQGRIMTEESGKNVIMGFFGGERAFPAWLTARAGLDGLFRVHFGLYDANAILPRPLHITVFFNIWQFGRLFLTDANANICDATGSTALHIAAGQGYPLIVRELLGRGARMDLVDASGAYPLHRAVRRGNHETLTQLLAADTDRTLVNAPDKYEFTPMHVACQLGWTQCVAILLQHDASPSNASGAVETPIGLAIENGHINVVRALLEHDSSLVDHCRRPFVQAARRGLTEMVKFLCEARVDTSYKDLLGQTALHKACIFGRMDLVEYLLDKGKAFVDAKDKSDRTPLYFAAERGHLDVVNCLLQHGADKNSIDRRYETALFKPAGNGHIKVVDRLLSAGTDATKLDRWQRTPLRFAAMRGQLEIVRMLLDRTEIKQDIPDCEGRTILHNAAAWLREGQEEIIDIIFQHGANPDARDCDERTAIHAAIEREQGEPPPTDVLLDRLVRGGVSIEARDKHGRTALRLAAATRNLTAVKFLLTAGAAPVNQSLHLAVRSGDIALVRPFLEQRTKLDLAERDWDGNTPLHIAASKGYKEILIALLDAGAPTRCLNMNQHTPLGVVSPVEQPDIATLLKNTDPTPGGDLQSRLASFDSSQVNLQDTLGRTLLHAAVLLGRAEAIRQLLDVGADTEIADQIGRTPLHYAVQRPDPVITEILIKVNAKIDVADARGRAPLYLAAEAGNIAQARVLLAAKAEFVRSHEGLTPLHAAVLGGSAQAVQTLLETDKGVELIAAQDRHKQTAIHLAAERGNSDVVQELLKHIQDATIVDSPDNEGQTALFHASKNGHIEVVRQLIRAGSIVYRTDKHRNMATHLAAEGGHLEIVSFLLDELPNQVEVAMTKWGQSLPGGPQEEGYRDPALLKAMAKVQAVVWNPGRTCWSADASKWASPSEQQKLQTDVVSKLRTFDEENHSVSSTTLMRAVQGGHVDVVKLILDRVPEMPLQAQHYWFSDALSLAASRGRTEIARLLIAAGSDVHAFTDMQMTCLHSAAAGGHGEMIELLLQHHAKPDLAQLRGGSTPLHLAAAGGHEAAVRALVRIAFVNIVDDLGRTPLHVACLGCHSAVVDVLIDADADLTARDFESRTPLELATGLSEQTQRRMEEQAKKQRQRSAAGY
ncbi:hypothetical protein SAMD00023353_0800260 [Rosellinia necatrix]|uniref:Uncharacterized protein n=1 Tax=Rosellinia necatrix TaxID=77044 RepID=A0A1S8A658_ROSNE|nr:hypothetical protein SAMD00023353_0800260 [Rosellinia necatrix]